MPESRLFSARFFFTFATTPRRYFGNLESFIPLVRGRVILHFFGLEKSQLKSCPDQHIVQVKKRGWGEHYMMCIVTSVLYSLFKTTRRKKNKKNLNHFSQLLHIQFLFLMSNVVTAIPQPHDRECCSHLLRASILSRFLHCSRLPNRH